MPNMIWITGKNKRKIKVAVDQNQDQYQDQEMIDHTQIDREIDPGKQEADLTREAVQKAHHVVVIRKETLIIQIFMFGE